MARLRPERLRDRIFAAALAVTALPFVVLVSMNRWEIRQADLAAEGGARGLSALVARAGTSPGWPELQRWVERDALLSGMRLRAVRADGARLLDVDRTLAPTFALGLGNFFYGPAAPGLASFDEEMGPLADRPESARGRAEPRVSQRFASKANLLSWASAQWLDGDEPVLLHVQAYSRRAALPGVVESRQVMKLLSLALALAVLSGWVLSRQLIKPLASLRQEVLRRATEAVPAATIDLGRRDEVGDVADAFNTLLAALNQRTKANEVFLTDLAHELKNPVAAIRTCAEVMVSSGELTHERAKKLSEALKQSSGQLDVLVTEFLELAGAEAGLSHEQREPVDVAAVLRGLQAGLAADPRWQAVTWKLGGLKAPSVVPGVTVRLERAFRNLLINALSFAGDTPWVEVALRRHEETCEVTVRDSGPGISPEQLPHLFERFFTTRRERSGTGLGLALTHAIVQAHGGSITVSSPPGQGAAFVVRLPAG